jgi:hypothetical protein
MTFSAIETSKFISTEIIKYMINIQPFYHRGPQSQEHLGVAPHWDGAVGEHHDLLAALHYQCSVVQY